jgi:hypothetical protein
MYTAICDLLNRAEPVDAISVEAELTRCGEAVRVGGAPYLHTLTEVIPTAANATYYAKIVRDRALLRRLVEVGTRAAQLGYLGEGEALDVVDQIQGEIMSLTQGTTTETGTRADGLMQGDEASGSDRGLVRQPVILLPVDGEERQRVGLAVNRQRLRRQVAVALAVILGEFARDLAATSIVKRFLLVLLKDRELCAVYGDELIGGDPEHDRDDRIDLNQCLSSVSIPPQRCFPRPRRLDITQRGLVRVDRQIKPYTWGPPIGIPVLVEQLFP